jgi:diguanylate cyclase (GGDEF)-like protein/PAS domain S-box-containing protein
MPVLSVRRSNVPQMAQNSLVPPRKRADHYGDSERWSSDVAPAARPGESWAGGLVVLKRAEMGEASVGIAGWDTPTVQMTRDISGVITSVDDAIVELLGWLPEQLVGLPSTNFIHPADQSGAVAAWMEMLTSPGLTGMWRGRYKTAKGSWKWVETENRVREDDDPPVLTCMREVSPAEATLEEQFQAREQLLNQLSDALPVGVFQVDLDGRITLTNNSLHAILGVPVQDSFDAQMSTVVSDDRAILEATLANVFACESADAVVLRLRKPSGESQSATTQDRVCLLSLRPLTDTAGLVSGAVGCLSDVTDQARLHEELEVRASIDQLTSCFNRAATIELLDRAFSAKHDGLGHAVLFVDLDGLKEVNDQFGHAAGDQLIVTAADHIRAALRDGDFVGRLGGDEFLVVCPRVLSSALAMEIGTRISAALTTSVQIGREMVEMRASVGAVWTMETLDTDTLIARADNAMYESKRSGNHGVTMFAGKDLDDGSDCAGDADMRKPEKGRTEQLIEGYLTGSTVSDRGNQASARRQSESETQSR